MPNDNIHIDKSLLCQIATGDEQAFCQLFNHYKDRFFFVALKMTRLNYVAEEMVQEVFLRIWNNRSTLSEIENPDAYFFTILYRRVYQHFRKAALDKKLLQAQSEETKSHNFTDETVLAREQSRLLEEAILKLPPQQQLIYRLNKLDGCSYIEIANKLNISPHTVRNHLATAVKSIRIYLRDFREFALLVIILMCISVN